MAQDEQALDSCNWGTVRNLSHIFKTLGMAIHPTKLGLALMGIILTLALGWLLDGIWTISGAGVSDDSIARFTQARQSDQALQEADGDLGVFSVLRQHQFGQVTDMLRSLIPGASLGAALGHVIDMGYGVWWVLRQHAFYALLFGLGALLIWSCAGGAICRIAAVEFAREEKPSAGDAIQYARGQLFGGFFLAPCIPMAFIAVTSGLLILGGMLLRLPVLGDLLAGGAFLLAIVGGFVITILLVGLLVGGSLLWPAIAVEGSDAFDAFSRSLSYPFSRPWKTLLYASVSLVYASLCWVFVTLFVSIMLKVTHAVVAFGTAPFGWWSRGDDGDVLVRKLDLLWPSAGRGLLYDWPDWAQLSWYEYFSAFFIGVCVLLVLGLMWSFLVSFYFSSSTVVYFLLRSDVDGTDLEDVYEGDEDSDPPESSKTSDTPAPLPKSATVPPAAAAPTAGDVSLPVTGDDPVPTGADRLQAGDASGTPTVTPSPEPSDQQAGDADPSAPPSPETVDPATPGDQRGET